MDYLFITGSSSGLGEATANEALANNFQVYGYARRCAIQHENYFHTTIDLSDIDAVRSVQFPDCESPGKLVLINNAGTAGEIKYFGEIDEQKIIEGYHINAIAPHLLMNKFIAKYSNDTCEKIIINITSGAAVSPYDGWSVYSSTKSALDMMSRVAALEQEIRKTNFRVFAIAPGVLDSPMQDKLRETDEHDFSRIDKFINLKKNHALTDPKIAAKKIIDIVRNPAQLSGVTHRLQL